MAVFGEQGSKLGVLDQENAHVCAEPRFRLTYFASKPVRASWLGWQMCEVMHAGKRNPLSDQNNILQGGRCLRQIAYANLGDDRLRHLGCRDSGLRCGGQVPSRLQFVLFWDNAINQMYVLVVLWKMTFLISQSKVALAERWRGKIISLWDQIFSGFSVIKNHWNSLLFDRVIKNKEVDRFFGTQCSSYTTRSHYSASVWNLVNTSAAIAM